MDGGTVLKLSSSHLLVLSLSFYHRGGVLSRGRGLFSSGEEFFLYQPAG